MTTELPIVTRLRKAKLWPDGSETRPNIATAHEAADLISELVGALRATTHEVEVVAALLYDESTRNDYIKIAADARAILAKATTHER